MANTELLFFNEKDLSKALPNLDGFADPQELGRFRGEVQIVIDGLTALSRYAQMKRDAMELRLDSKIEGAREFEDTADRIYCELPTWARW